MILSPTESYYNHYMIIFFLISDSSYRIYLKTHPTKKHVMIRINLPGGGGGTLIVSYIRRLGPFLGFKILNFNILGGGGFRKMNIFWL